eukprot:CAMPEP_0178427214 /NCGR_PEP_ID=MMETSP0689_2-20121128/29627_1 /TAXON_ID=160604 /ORGANISM="Amphidinium massartii, Strain CS-259" /LENGTH=37 /DNA_ID= /DNA_START= /DNA_END= /DNA_ORIENTATION=
MAISLKTSCIKATTSSLVRVDPSSRFGSDSSLKASNI